MKNLFVPYEQALQLKELGFDERCLAFYNGKFLQSTDYDFDNSISKDIGLCIVAPLYQQAFRWLRDKYNLVSKVDVCANKYDSVYYDTTIIDCKKLIVCDNQDNGKYNTYEEAELACIIKLIEIAKEQNTLTNFTPNQNK
jgi:hypothetical protein